MKAGNLVKTTKARIGCPAGTLGLILEKLITTQDTLSEENGFEVKPLEILVVQMFGYANTRRWLSQDLEVVS
jgi:hypothetical protein